jgi:hypothetical protein
VAEIFNSSYKKEVTASLFWCNGLLGFVRSFRYLCRGLSSFCIHLRFAHWAKESSSTCFIASNICLPCFDPAQEGTTKQPRVKEEQGLPSRLPMQQSGLRVRVLWSIKADFSEPDHCSMYIPLVPTLARGNTDAEYLDWA